MPRRFTDAETISATGAFLVGELERLDARVYEPIADFTYGRDIDLRDDVTIADEVSSFIQSEYMGGFGGTGAGKKSFIKGPDSTPARVSVSLKKVATPLTLWGMEVAYTIFELQKAMQAGRPIDVQKHSAMRMKHQLDIDTQVYVGDDEVGVKGLLNSDQVTHENVGTWIDSTDVKTVIGYFNNILEKAWKATQYNRIPKNLLVPPAIFGKLVSTQLTNTEMNLLRYVEANNLSVANGGTLTIRPVRWLADTSLFSTPRIVAYTKAVDVVRFPLVPIASLPVQYRNFEQAVPYFAALGGVEFVRPEMVYYADLAAVSAG